MFKNVHYLFIGWIGIWKNNINQNKYFKYSCFKNLLLVGLYVVLAFFNWLITIL